MLADAAIWVPNGLSQVGLARVRLDSESPGNPVTTLEEMLVCPSWQPNLIGTVTALAGTLASRLLFGKSRMGRSACLLESVGFSFFFIDLFYLLFEGFGLFSPDTSPLF